MVFDSFLHTPHTAAADKGAQNINQHSGGTRKVQKYGRLKNDTFSSVKNRKA
jgi:hypothetical protein